MSNRCDFPAVAVATQPYLPVENNLQLSSD